jgi:heptosyltransferase-2
MGPPVSDSLSLFQIRAPASVAVAQPLPGIGDMIWHLPHIRALSATIGGPITLITKPRSVADQLLTAETAVRDILWLDRNPEGRRGTHDGLVGLLRFAASLRARRFTAIVILHHSATIAAAALLAGIPMRFGYGIGAQRLMLNQGPVLPRAIMRQHQFKRATAWLRAAGIAMRDAEPQLVVGATARQGAMARLAGVARPFVAIGIGASEPSRQWGASRFADLLRGLRELGWTSLVLLGGQAETAMANEITRLAGAEGITVATGWRLDVVAALLAEAAFYVGNNTGVMNMAAAVGIPTYALFGTTPVFDHSRHIIPIASPADPGAGDDGMSRITPDAVLAVLPSGPLSLR